MSTLKVEPVVIVGGGLAGTILALSCYDNNIPFHLKNIHNPSCSSLVAAGMWNPITFKKCNLSWRAVEQINALFPFYKSWEDKLNVSFFHPMTSKKLVSDPEYFNNWTARSAKSPYNRFLGDLQALDTSEFPTLKNGGERHVALVNEAGYVDVPVFINAAHAYLKNEGLYSEENYNASEAVKSMNLVVFAEGYGLKLNPYFNYLPLNGTHGDILTIKTNVYSKSIFNFGKFLLPLSNGTFRYGSTYNWQTKESSTTEQGKAELTEHWHKHFDSDFEVVDQKAGLRPTVTDRTPLVGQHPEHKNMYCFNGLGTKGVMIAPWLAQHFIDTLKGESALDKELDIKRFESLWTKLNT